MLQIAYMSRATTPMTLRTYTQLVHQAQRRNEADGITGLLVYDGARFLQALEGPAEPARACMGRIARDRRHSSITLIHEVPIERREFAAFSMAGQVPGLPGSDAFVDRIKALVDDVTLAPLKAMFIGFAVLGREKTPILIGPDQE